jgi:monoamine oxidase
LEDQAAFGEALDAFHERVSEAAKTGPDRAMSTVLDPQSPWNGLINAVNTYISGAEVERVSMVDFDRYEDTSENWRVTGGYGALIAKYGATSPVAFDCPVQNIDHSGKRLRIQTGKGAITADRVIVTLPSSVLAEREALFLPALPDKTTAARGLPLGLADKLFLSLEDAQEFENDTRVFGHIDRSATAGYSLRPFGWPMIECYFGGELAAELEKGGERAFFDFAASELTGVLGNNFAKRIKPIAHHGWLSDPFARGSYSYAVPGKADQRAVLATAVDNRIFFAGEATSEHDFSTAHGALLTGQRAAREAIAARGPR